MIKELEKYHKYKNPIKSSRYHKTYYKGYVDYYVGISVPILRKISKSIYKTISYLELVQLITNKIHEYRLLALIVLNDKIKKANITEQKKIVEFYLKNIKYVNNWDLVDVSSYSILGKYFFNINDFSLLYEFSYSKNLWIKRISIVATNYLIKKDIFNITLDIVDNLIEDKHDLIHKANGWMLRNVGDKTKSTLTEYLFVNYDIMPRTTLRYAIEHYPENERKSILKGDFSWR